MTRIHRLDCTASPSGFVLECEEPECGRRLVIDRNRREMVIIDHGDQHAQHFGSMGGIEVTQVTVGPR
jgi:hypothetical protein